VQKNVACTKTQIEINTKKTTKIYGDNTHNTQTHIYTHELN